MNKKIVGVIKKTLLGIGLLLTASSTSVNATGVVISPPALPHGHSYDEWAAAWWQWTASIPASTNPILDSTGDLADEGQNGSVWFLGGSFVEAQVNRDITIPPGKSLFFPSINLVADTLFDDPHLTAQELEDLGTFVIDLVDSNYARIDGKDIATHRAKSGAVTIILPLEDSLLEFFYGEPISGEVYPTITEGYWVFLSPLEPGEHVLEFGGCISAFEFCTDVTYNITVLP